MIAWINIFLALTLGLIKIGLCSMIPDLEGTGQVENLFIKSKTSSESLFLDSKHKDQNQLSLKPEDEEKITRIYFDNEAPLAIDCVYPQVHKHVIWERTDLIYPLAVGGYIFSPDPRVKVNYPSDTLSRLSIANATVEDAKTYRCRSSPPVTPKCANTSCPAQEEPFEKTFYAIFGKKPTTSMQAIDTEGSTTNFNSKVTILGPQLAFYGMPLELICRANFSSNAAKSDPGINLEWYHNGVRRRPSRVQSGGTFISSRWVDSNLLESRLLITWTSEKEAGRWNCVERSRVNRQRLSTSSVVSDDSNPGGTPFMSFDQLNIQIIGRPEPEYDEYETPPPIVAFAATAASPNPEAVNPKSSKFRRYLQLTESSGRWRKIPVDSANPHWLCLLPTLFIWSLCTFLVIG